MHITGTDFYEPIENDAFLATRYLWDQHLVSENPEVYRAEYLATTILFDAEMRANGYSVDDLQRATSSDEDMLKIIRCYVESRYDQGYERGVHDLDTTAHSARAVLSLYATAGLLRFSPGPRALATLFWANAPEDDAPKEDPSMSLATSHSRRTLSAAQKQRVLRQRRARSLGRLRELFSDDGPLEVLIQDIAKVMAPFVQEHELPFAANDVREAAHYLVEELSAEQPRFVVAPGQRHGREVPHAPGRRPTTKRDFEEDLRSTSTARSARAGRW